ncbi:putative subunit of the RNA polymerase II-associated Paf1 complex [Scheffersomyces amazonensis]|uniref:putative subunit of the RNA polymerase II-associated Paf1 complex n=1 Tax=Scheffersomyces amazonensis TaxID=1078765 RepID=UPI00315CDB35
MSDLEDDLLALAGGDDEEEEYSGKEEVRSHAGHGGDQDENDNDEDDEGHNEIIKSSKRSSRRYDEDEGEYDSGNDEVYSKRRKIQEDEDEDDEDDEYELPDVPEPELINPYPLEGKYKNEQDRDDLEDMDEIQREQILFDRTQEMERYNEKLYLQQRMKQQKQLGKPSSLPAKPSRSSNRDKTSSSKTSKLDKLNELKKQRQQKSRRRRDDYDEDESEEESEDDLDDEQELDEDEEEYDDGIVTWGGKSKVRSSARKSTQLGGVEDINRIRFGRTKLAQYCYYSEFPEIIVDTYGKINLGFDKRTRQPLYRLVKIIDVEHKPPKAYKLPGGVKCDIFLVVSQNSKQTKAFPITIFSDSSISNEEFQRYIHELEKNGEQVDYLDDIKEKYQTLKAFVNKSLTDKDVNEIIAKKQQLQNKNIKDMSLYDAVKRKAQLLDEVKIAHQQRRSADSVLEELSQLDKYITEKRSADVLSSASSMTKVNERNRKLNQTNIRKAEIRNQLSQPSSGNSDGGDPFSRLKTVTRIFYQDLINAENEKALNDAKLNYEKTLNEKSKQEEEISRSTYRELGEMDKLIKSIDIDIDIDIDLV